MRSSLWNFWARPRELCCVDGRCVMPVAHTSPPRGNVEVLEAWRNIFLREGIQ